VDKSPEVALAELVAAGVPAAEIAARLGLSLEEAGAACERLRKTGSFVRHPGDGDDPVISILGL
jgi:hypothetical protein